MEFKLNDVQDNKQECMKLTLPVKILPEHTHAFKDYISTRKINGLIYQVVPHEGDLFIPHSWIGKVANNGIEMNNVKYFTCVVNFLDTHISKAFYNYIVQNNIDVTLCPHYIHNSGKITKLIGFSLEFDN